MAARKSVAKNTKFESLNSPHERKGPTMTDAYTYEHMWDLERVRLAGLEAALDPGTRAHLVRLGVRAGVRCLEIGAGGGSIAFWLAAQVGPGGKVVATDLETDFLESAASDHAGMEVLRHDLMRDELPSGFDIVHARWLVEWMPDKRLALQRMASALKPGGMLLVEEPDFVTIFEAAEPAALRRVFVAAMQHLESISPIDVRYGRRVTADLAAAGLQDVEADGRCPIVHGGSPLAADFLRLTIEKLREPVLAAGDVSLDEFEQTVHALQDPSAIVVAPMTVAAWGRRP
jgi:2-polyprenyl-3-methyl-5-hydroxy-6-metoxy-1,4-benzoquinol methylase